MREINEILEGGYWKYEPPGLYDEKYRGGTLICETYAVNFKNYNLEGELELQRLAKELQCHYLMMDSDEALLSSRRSSTGWSRVLSFRFKFETSGEMLAFRLAYIDDSE